MTKVKVVSQVLRRLTAYGIISRRLFPDIPPRAEYTVSEFGNTLLPHVEALISKGRTTSTRLWKTGGKAKLTPRRN